MTDLEKSNERWTKLSDNCNDYVISELNSERPGHWVSLIKGNAPKREGLSVLDAGCGPFFFPVILSKAGFSVTGIDGSERMQGDFGVLPFEDEHFDLVVCREWYRVLKPGGVLLIFDANWHLPYHPGTVREQAIKREGSCLKEYKSGYIHDGSYEYIDSELDPERYEVFGTSMRPDFDYGVLKQTHFGEISFVRDVTERLWSEKEKLLYGATPLFMLRAVK